MGRTLVTCLIAMLPVLSVAQTPAKQAPSPKIRPVLSLGTDLLLPTGVQVSPFGLKYRTKFASPSYGGTMRLLLQGRSSSSYGIFYHGFAGNISLEELQREGRVQHTYAGIAWEHQRALRPRLALRQGTGLGVVYLDAYSRDWTTRQKYSSHAWGWGADYHISLDYRVAARASIGLYLQLQSEMTFRWSGEADPNSYTGSFWGKDTNVGFYPRLGIVFSSPW